MTFQCAESLREKNVKVMTIHRANRHWQCLDLSQTHWA
ncbi:hypothetical protein SynA1560_01471 [Synechococcus sp. A15-60]|nr:hypothetical protein SynA1560_01471 [Synechococcus sp. A15-60]